MSLIRTPLRLRRFWVNHWICNWGNNFRRIKWAYQRVFRGYDDTVAWSIDYYLNGIMPSVLRQLKENKHGTPMTVFPTGDEYTDEDGNPTEAASKVAQKRWDEILDKIIAGFEANAQLLESPKQEEQNRIWEEGSKLFIKHYNSLWD